MKHVLLTGVAGFIGAHTLEHFLEKTDWHIVGIDSLEHRGDMRRVNQVIGKHANWAKRFEFYKIDLAKPWALANLSRCLKRNPDYIVNMAAESHVDRSITDPVPFVKNNVDLVLTMLEYAREVKPRVFIQISTDEVYGPMYDRPFLEGDALTPSNPYSASKAAQEMIAISYWRTYGVPLVITNTMNNIGEMQDGEKFVPLLIKKILAGEKVKIHGSKKDMGSRYYLHARNHADALLFILNMARPVGKYTGENGTTRPDRYHIVGDTRVGNLDMAERVAQLCQKPLRFEYDASVRPGHDLHYGLNGDKLKILGWMPPMEFDESLERTVDNYLEHPQWLQ